MGPGLQVSRVRELISKSRNLSQKSGALFCIMFIDTCPVTFFFGGGGGWGGWWRGMEPFEDQMKTDTSPRKMHIFTDVSVQLSVGS